MTFITQPSDENSCGAYCLCYLNWLEMGRAPEKGPEPDDRKQAASTYGKVMVGDAEIPGKLRRDYCDPVKMMNVLLESQHDAHFSLTAGTMIDDILKDMMKDGQPEQAAIKKLMDDGRVKYAAPEIPQGKEASIAVYAVTDREGKTFLGLHYILLRRGSANQLCRYNPWTGTAERSGGYETFDYFTLRLVSVGAAIIVK